MRNHPRELFHSHCGETHWSGDTSPGVHSFNNCTMMHSHPHSGPHEHETPAFVSIILLKHHEAYLLTVPWIRAIRGSMPCEWTTERCNKRGRYHYVPIRSSHSMKGNFCANHLPISHNYGESQRLDRWMAKNPPPWRSNV